jgi:hypothetical protein
MGAVNDPNAEASALIWDQVKQQLADQRTSLDLLRTRTTAMLSVATLVAGLFGLRLPGAHTPLHGRVLVAVIVALTLFGVSALVAVLALVPRDAWMFALDVDSLIQDVKDGGAVPVDVTWNLSRESVRIYNSNSVKLRKLYQLFSAVCFLVALQVFAWGIAAL